MSLEAAIPEDLFALENEYPELESRRVCFDSLACASSDQMRQSILRLHEQRILAWLGDDAVRPEALAQYRRSHVSLQACEQATSDVIDGFAASWPLSVDAWNEHVDTLVSQRRQALLEEARLQVFENILDSNDLRRLEHALAGGVQDPGEPVQVSELRIVDGEESYPIAGALVIETTAVPTVLLYVPGIDGGLQRFDSLQVLKDRVRFTLQCSTATPFWRQVPASMRDAAMASEQTLATRSVQGIAMVSSVQAQFDALDSAIKEAQGGKRLHADADSLEATLLWLKLETLDNLRIPVNEARNLAIDRIAEQQRTSALVAQLPGWLLQASESVREEYARRFGRYQQAAQALEKHLETLLPSLATFTAHRFSARLKQDFGTDLDTDRVIVDLPVQARFQEVPIAQGLPLPTQWRWVLSDQRIQYSLSELARLNFAADDSQMAARCSAVKISHAVASTAGLPAGLDGPYLMKVVPQLDIAGQYQALLASVFNPPSADQDLLLKPYELCIRLDGFVAQQRGYLNEAGLRLLERAAGERAHIQGLQMAWVIFKPGESVSGERSSVTARGLCVVHDTVEKTTLVYLPQAPRGRSLIQADSIEEARERLIQRLREQPDCVDYLVSRIADDEEAAAHKSYIEQSLIRRFDGFLDVQVALDLQMAAQQLRARAWLLERDIQRHARSAMDIRREQKLRDSQLGLDFLKAILSFAPGLGTLFSAYDGWHDGHGAAEAFNRGSVAEGMALAGSSALGLLDILLSVVPGVASVAVVARAARRTTRLRQAAQRVGSTLPITAKRYVLKPFEGYQVQASLAGAVAQTGRRTGTWLHDGKLWIRRQDQVYQVYQRAGEHTLRLKKTGVHGYEPPVRQNARGDWVYHTDVGLRGGVRSGIAETLISEAAINPRLTRTQARELLDQFNFPTDKQRRLELDVAVHYQAHHALPDWVESYRRPTAVTSPLASSPQPGPSSLKRKQPGSPDSDAVRQPRQPLPPGGTIPAHPPGVWRGWGQPMKDLTVLEVVDSPSPIYRLADMPEEFIAIEGALYEILPPGSVRNTATVFLKNPSISVDTFSALNHAIRQGAWQQPLMAKYSSGRWNVEGPLFSKTIHHLVEESRPGFTLTSRQVLAEKLFDMADVGTGVTATRLINMKAALNAWRRGGTAPLANLNDPLLMLNSTRPSDVFATNPVINISYESSHDTFYRLDFNHETVDPRFLEAPLPDTVRPQFTGWMATVMAGNGYTRLTDGAMTSLGRSTSVFQRPGQPEVYLLYVRRCSDSKVTLRPVVSRSVPDLPMIHPGSNRWVDWLVSRHSSVSMASVVESAKAQGKLIKLIGGTNITGLVQGSRQIFVMRIADDF